jgi:cation:H+ antiporter
MELSLLILGLAGLWLGTEATIRGAVAVAERLHVSEFIIGVVVLSVGSDLPELAIAIDAAIKILNSSDASDVVIGSSLGSALGQIGFVMGVAGLMGTLTLPRRIVYGHGGMLLGSLVLLGLFGLDGQVTRTEGLSLVIVYAIYVFLLLADAFDGEDKETSGDEAPLSVSFVYLAVGLILVIVCAELTVSSATALAVALNVEQSVIAIVIIGLGSSLPELSISVAAIMKGRNSLSVGNLIGSNVFDTLVPVGVAAAIAKLQFNPEMLHRELPFLVLLTAVVLILFHRKRGIQRGEAAVILGLYLGYVVLLLVGAQQ